jgi:arginase family enzyme
MDNSIHLNFDGAWTADTMQLRTLDFRDLGPRLRYFAGRAALDEFDERLPRDLPPFVLYGSGDFHHLSALWVRRAVAALGAGGDLTLICFDNHPDWDVRPPHWSCGGWINRVLEMSAIRNAQVWGCGNFELTFPARLFANRAALRDARLVVHPWAERYGKSVRDRFDCVNRVNWRSRFDLFTSTLARANVYISIDLDCLTADAASTNWENGLFTAEEIAWAVGELRARAKIVGGDLCGAYSPSRCRGIMRRLAAWWDHPPLPAFTFEQAQQTNTAALKTIWPALTA